MPTAVRSSVPPRHDAAPAPVVRPLGVPRQSPIDAAQLHAGADSPRRRSTRAPTPRPSDSSPQSNELAGGGGSPGPLLMVLDDDFIRTTVQAEASLAVAPGITPERAVASGLLASVEWCEGEEGFMLELHSRVNDEPDGRIALRAEQLAVLVPLLQLLVGEVARRGLLPEVLLDPGPSPLIRRDA
jgi:hypothetical protein